MKPGPRHTDSMTKLPRGTVVTVRAMAVSRGIEPTAKLLGTSTSVIYRIIGAGALRPDTAARIVARVEEMQP